MLNDLGQGLPAEWEIPVLEAWQEHDPLMPERVPEWVVVPPGSTQRGAGWRRLPPLLRARAWREREIAANLYNRLDLSDWSQLQGVGVVSLPDFRRFERRLAGAIFVSSPSDAYAEDIYRQLGLDTTVTIATRVFPPEQYGIEQDVPIVILPARSLMPYSSSPSITLHSGVAIEGNHPPGMAQPASGARRPVSGTLTAIAQRNQQDLLVGPHHVFGDIQKTIRVGNQTVAEVVDTDPQLDAALAEPLNASMTLSNTVPALGKQASAPVLPCTGIPVQYEGATSQQQQAHTIDTVYYASPSITGSPVSIGSPLFSVTIPAAQGDSGALLTTQSGSVPQRYQRQNPQLKALYDGAMVGMLVAGPDPPMPGPQTIYFCPIVDIGDQFNLDW